MKTKVCSKCGVKRRLDSRLGWQGRVPKARVCNSCTRKRTRGQTRGQRVMETYGLTLTEVAEVFAAQGFVCAICQGKRPGNLDIDHCHKTGVIRGLCCRRCNRRLLPAALDNVAILLRAIEYLNHPPAVQVLGERTVPDGK